MNSWNHEIMTSSKGYANDVESMLSFLKLNLNKFLGCKNQMFNAWNIFLNEHIDSTLILSSSTSLAYPLNDVMVSRIHKAFYYNHKSPKNGEKLEHLTAPK